MTQCTLLLFSRSCSWEDFGVRNKRRMGDVSSLRELYSGEEHGNTNDELYHLDGTKNPSDPLTKRTPLKMSKGSFISKTVDKLFRILRYGTFSC